MKKLSLILVFIVTLSLLCSCALGIFDYSYYGIENFHPALSNVGVCRQLIPENFLESYEYEDGDFFYECDKNFSSKMIDRALLYLIYNDTEYALAKECVLSQLSLRDTGEVLNEYVFFENIRFTDEWFIDHVYPYDYNMVAFNDNSNTIVFFGLYSDIARDNPDDSIASHVIKYYGDWYNFN